MIETGLIEEVEKSQLHLREYFKQEDLPIAFQDPVERIKNIVSKVSLKDYYRSAIDLEEYLYSLKQTISPVFEKHPLEVSVGANSETREIKKERRNAFIQEIKTGIETMMDFENFIAQNPEIAAEELLSHFFEDREGRLIPRGDVTNEQAFCLLAMGMTYLLDHHVLKLAKAEYGNNAGRVAGDLYNIKLKFPKKARVGYGNDVGLVLYVPEADFALFRRKKKKMTLLKVLILLAYIFLPPSY